MNLSKGNQTATTINRLLYSFKGCSHTYLKLRSLSTFLWSVYGKTKQTNPFWACVIPRYKRDRLQPSVALPSWLQSKDSSAWGMPGCVQVWFRDLSVTLVTRTSTLQSFQSFFKCSFPLEVSGALVSSNADGWQSIFERLHVTGDPEVL